MKGGTGARKDRGEGSLGEEPKIRCDGREGKGREGKGMGWDGMGWGFYDMMCMSTGWVR